MAKKRIVIYTNRGLYRAALQAAERVRDYYTDDKLALWRKMPQSAREAWLTRDPLMAIMVQLAEALR